MAWLLSDCRTKVVVPSTPGPSVVVVTNHRVIWRRRLSDDFFVSGHARYDWVMQVDTFTTGPSAGDFGPHVVMVLYAAKADAPINQILLRIPVDDPDVAVALGHWIELLAASYKLETFTRLDVNSDVVAEAEDIKARAQAEPGNGHKFHSTAIGNSFRRGTDGTLSSGTNPPEGFEGTSSVLIEDDQDPPPVVAAHAGGAPTGAGVGDDCIIMLPTAQYLGLMLIEDGVEQPGIYPQFRDGALVPEEGDGTAVSYRFSSVMYTWSENWTSDNGYFGPGTLTVTQSRVVLEVDEFPRNQYFGFGLAGGLRALIDNAQEKKRVKELMAGVSLAGHLRLDWLQSVAYFNTGDLILRVVDEVTVPSHPVPQSWNFTLPSAPSKDLAEYLAAAAAQRRLRRSGLPDDAREQLAALKPRTYERKKKVLTTYDLPADAHISRSHAFEQPPEPFEGINTEVGHAGQDLSASRLKKKT